MSSPAAVVQEGPTLIAALSYARRGWRVLPVYSPTPDGACTCGNAGCKDQGKHPRIKDWTNAATTDEKTIRGWFTRWPDANVGIATGRESGIIVLDVDKRHGGMESLAEMERQHGELPKTPTVRTGNGYHLYFRHPGGTIKNAVELAGLPGLDVRADGGFVVAPPSRHVSGASYLVEADPETFPLQDCGTFLEGATKAAGNGHPGPKLDTAAVLAGVPAGQRDTAIFKLASKLRGADVPIEIAKRLAVEAAEKAEQPAGDPFTPERARAKVRAAYSKYPAGTSQEAEEDPEVQSWPDPPAPAAYRGVLGDIVRAVEPYTEADPIGILAQSLIGLGNLIGGGPYFKVEATEHRINEFGVLLGHTAGGRKGTAWDQARRPLASVDEAWAKERIQGGLASGEGLIHAVRDARQERRPIIEKGRCAGYETVETDAGVSDKRLLVVETEFARVLKVMSREGATLSTIIRQAWDGPNLRAMAKQAGATATGAHVSVIAHITPEELIRQLEETEAASGFGNRFLWVCVKRARFLPDGADLSAVDFAPLLNRLSAAVSFARRVGAMKRDPEARDLWRSEYPRLSTGRPGLLGAMLSRAEAHVLRLSMLYALADASAEIRRPHLEAALALWDYCERSAAFVFGDKLGDPTADELLRALRAAPAGMSRTDIRDHFGRNKSAAEIGRALGVLARQGLARSVTVKGEGGGRPVETWTATKAGEA